MALVDVPVCFTIYGFTDGLLHNLRWEIRVGDGSTFPGRVRIFIDDRFVAEANTSKENDWKVGC